jgi:hypothetical protein
MSREPGDRPNERETHSTVGGTVWRKHDSYSPHVGIPFYFHFFFDLRFSSAGFTRKLYSTRDRHNGDPISSGTFQSRQRYLYR